MAYPLAGDMKVWLRLPPDADTELDGRLTALITAAVEYIETATGNTFNNPSVADTPEQISLAIKVYAGFYYEQPVPEQKALDAMLRTVGILIAGNRVWNFPSDNA